MPFTAEELEEMRRADEEIDADFRLNPDDLRRSRLMDREAMQEMLRPEKRKVVERQRAYREANRDKVAEYQRAYREKRRKQDG